MEVRKVTIGDVLEDNLSEICPHLSTSDLLSARMISKNFAAVASGELFFRRNRSALFAQTALVKNEVTDDSVVSLGLRELWRSFRNMPQDFANQVDHLSLISRLLGLDFDFLAENQDKISQLINGDIYYNDWETRNLYALYLILNMATSDKSVTIGYLPYLLSRLQARDERDFSAATRAVHFVLPILDQTQLLLYLEQLRMLKQESSRRNVFWDRQVTFVMRPMFKYIALRLNSEVVQSYARVLLAELKFQSQPMINPVILGCFADKLSDEIVAESVTFFLGRLKRMGQYYDDGHAIFPILGALTSFINANKLTQAAMRDCLAVVIPKLCVDQMRHALDDEIIFLARAIANKMDNAELMFALAPHLNSENKFIFNFLQAFSPALSGEQWRLYQSFIMNCFKMRENVGPAFSILMMAHGKFEPTVLDEMVEAMVVYLSDAERPGHVECADNWFLACEEQLSSVTRTKYREKFIASIDAQVVGAASVSEENRTHYLMHLNLRLQRVATLFDHDEAKRYLPIVLAYLRSCHFSAELERHLAPLQAILTRMNKADIRNEWLGILQAIPQEKQMVNQVAVIEFLSYWIIEEVCSLEELKQWSSLSRLFTDFSISLLEVMAKWLAMIKATPVVRLPSVADMVPAVVKFSI